MRAHHAKKNVLSDNVFFFSFLLNVLSDNELLKKNSTLIGLIQHHNESMTPNILGKLLNTSGVY